MIQKIFNRVFVDYDEGVIYIAFPDFWWRVDVDRALFSTSSIIMLAITVEMGQPIAVPKTCL